MSSTQDKLTHPEELIMSLINSDLVLSQDTWTVSVVSNGNKHGFLIFERIERSSAGSEPSNHTWYRADLRPSSLRKAFLIGTPAKITFTTMTKAELQELQSQSCFRHAIIPGVNPESAKAILTRIGNGIVHGEKIGYCVYREFHNCIYWCQKVMKEELGYEVGSQGTLIELPGVIVSGGVKKSKN